MGSRAWQRGEARCADTDARTDSGYRLHVPSQQGQTSHPVLYTLDPAHTLHPCLSTPTAHTLLLPPSDSGHGAPLGVGAREFRPFGAGVLCALAVPPRTVKQTSMGAPSFLARQSLVAQNKSGGPLSPHPMKQAMKQAFLHLPSSCTGRDSLLHSHPAHSRPTHAPFLHPPICPTNQALPHLPSSCIGHDSLLLLSPGCSSPNTRPSNSIPAINPAFPHLPSSCTGRDSLLHSHPARS